MLIKKLWGWLGDNDKQVAILLALAMASYAIFEYKVSVKAARVVEAMKFFDRYSEGDVNESRSDLMDFGVRIESEEWYANVKAHEYHDHFLGRLAEEGLKDDVYRLLVFFRSAAV